MIQRSKILRVFEDHATALKQFGVHRIGVFGSYARNTQRKSSDVDVLVEFKKGAKTFDHYIDLKDFLEKKFKRKVDLVIKEALKKQIRSQVLRDTLYAGI
ncbi:MAG: nucleotidyltransferase family protein [Candidatus Omnitrophota bacterium]|nr:nucleotidyltransferase family protein [Candidatus Omnitrophota bacterium]